MIETTSRAKRVSKRSLIYQDVKRRLEILHCEVADEIKRLAEDLEGEWQDRDSPSEDEIREVEYSRREALQTRLRQINEALERMRHNTYGVCIDCKKRIPVKRLFNDLTVSRCLACQTIADGPVPDYSL